MLKELNQKKNKNMSNLQQESSKRSRPRIRNESIEVNYKPRRSKGDGNLKKKIGENCSNKMVEERQHRHTQ